MFRGRLLTPMLLSFLIVGCTSASNSSAGSPSNDDSGPSSAQVESASRICAEARRQLTTMAGGNEILLSTCEAQSDGAGNVGLVFVLNDYIEWTSLLATQSTEDLVFTVPLGLVAYAFGGSAEEPNTFDSILIMFKDAKQTVYDMTPADLDEVLKAQTREEADAALRTLRDRIRITSLGWHPLSEHSWDARMFRICAPLPRASELRILAFPVSLVAVSVRSCYSKGDVVYVVLSDSPLD